MSLRFWRWQLEAERPSIEHVVPEQTEQDDVVLDDGKIVVRIASTKSSQHEADSSATPKASR